MGNRIIEDRHIAIIKSGCEAGLSDREIAEQLFVDRSTVGIHRRRLGIVRAGYRIGSKSFPLAKQEQILELLLVGEAQAVIAEKVGCHEVTVKEYKKVLQKRGLIS